MICVSWTNDSATVFTPPTHLIIPNLDGPIVRPRQNIGLVPGGIIVHTIHSPLVTFERVMRHMRAQSPDLDGAIEGSGRKGIGVFGVEFDLHDVMRVAFKELGAVKVAVPVPQFNGHVVAGAEDVRERRMNFEGANVIGMGLPLVDLFHRVVIQDP